MTFTFNTSVPAANNNPSVDQPDMLTNNVSINGILAVDHISFNAPSGGQHLQVHLNATPNYIATPPAPVGNDSIIYTSAGTSSTAAQLKFVNSNVTFPLNALVAYGIATIAGLSQSFNVVSSTRLGVGHYEIVLTAGATTGQTFGVNATAVLDSSTVSIISNYIITGNNTFRLRFNAVSASTLNPADPAFFTFTVYQL